MLGSELHAKVAQRLGEFADLKKSYEIEQGQMFVLGEQIEAIRKEQGLLEDAKVVLEEVKKVITKTSLEYCERLATMAIRSIFNIDAEVKYSSSEGKFYLVYPSGFVSDLTADEGGGYQTVISFVFSLYLVIKSGSRRVMFFDEAFTCISEEYLPSFVAFVRQMCKELGFDLCLVSHDSRISDSDVDHVYVVAEGRSTKLK